MIELESNVRDNVTRLLTMLSPQVSEDSETFINVRDKLTRMAILGTLPPASRSSAKNRSSRSADWPPAHGGYTP